MSTYEMTPPPCADHAESELSCPVCTARRRQFYKAMGTPFEDAESTSAALARVELSLSRVDEAAGRDIAAPDEPLVQRVADLRRGRTEATQRVLELAAELASAQQELDALRTVRDQLQRDLAYAKSAIRTLTIALDNPLPRANPAGDSTPQGETS